MKALIKKGDELYLVLLVYTSNPLSDGYLPEKLLMNKKLRTNVPSFREAWKAHVPDRKLLVERKEELRWKQKVNFIYVTGLGICCQNFLWINMSSLKPAKRDKQLILCRRFDQAALVLLRAMCGIQD